MEMEKIQIYKGYTIKIWNDSQFSGSPCTSWDMAAKHIFGHSNRWDKSLSNESHADDIDVSTMFEAVLYLIANFVPENVLFNYYKKHPGTFKIEYNKSTRMWELQGFWEGAYHKESELTPKEIKEGYTFDFMYYFTNYESKELKGELMSIIYDSEDVYVHEDTLTGYCQGDYMETLSFITKNDFMHEVTKDMNSWKDKSEKIIRAELDDIECWAFGDVYGYTIDNPEGNEIESIGGYYTKDTDGIISECITIINNITNAS